MCSSLGVQILSLLNYGTSVSRLSREQANFDMSSSPFLGVEKIRVSQPMSSLLLVVLKPMSLEIMSGSSGAQK